MNLPESDFEVFDHDDAAAQLAGVRALASGCARVVDLGAGRGRISVPLASDGALVLAVDRSSAALGSSEWDSAPNIVRLQEDFLDSQPDWIAHGPFDLICCLGNTLNLVLDTDLITRFFDLAFRAAAPGGRLICDDVPFWGEELRDPELWPCGLSLDGRQQLAWTPEGSCFAYRTGRAVDPDRLHPHPEERLLRLWSVSELNEVAIGAGWAPAVHREEGLIMSFLKED
ncbi:MAG: class I SAM-dependent methyltransferase [Planctomycetota bacterium]|nr:class I SAM-dependent methyltransferase [Planctomycetota bacterium]